MTLEVIYTTQIAGGSTTLPPFLQTCKDVEAFNNTKAGSLEKLKKLSNNVSLDSPTYIEIQKTIKRTELRFEKYKNLNCGSDGLPHIALGSASRQVIAPGLLFLYISGWIGWVGRKYVQYTNSIPDPSERPFAEIIINVPKALKIMSEGYKWPIDLATELRTNKFFIPDDEIRTSPR
jgi:photosystem I subunit 3